MLVVGLPCWLLLALASSSSYLEYADLVVGRRGVDDVLELLLGLGLQVVDQVLRVQPRRAWGSTFAHTIHQPQRASDQR